MRGVLACMDRSCASGGLNVCTEICMYIHQGTCKCIHTTAREVCAH